MGSVWDRTAEVLNGRGGMLAGIAALTLFAPTVARDGVAFLLGAGDPATPPASGPAALVGLVGIVATLVMIYGQFALIAAASDPATGRSDALRIAGRRFLPGIGLLLLFGLVFAVLAIPFAAILVGSGVDLVALRSGSATLPPGSGGLLALYTLVFLAIALWLNARFALLLPVIVNERLGMGSFRRAFAVTRGMTWRIIGVLVLFVVLAGVAVLASQMVAGVVFRLILGSEHVALALLLAALVVAAVTAGVTVVYTSFAAQLYVACRQEQAGIAVPR